MTEHMRADLTTRCRAMLRQFGYEIQPVQLFPEKHISAGRHFPNRVLAKHAYLPILRRHVPPPRLRRRPLEVGIVPESWYEANKKKLLSGGASRVRGNMGEWYWKLVEELGVRGVCLACWIGNGGKKASRSRCTS